MKFDFETFTVFVGVVLAHAVVIAMVLTSELRLPSSPSSPRSDVLEPHTVSSSSFPDEVKPEEDHTEPSADLVPGAGTRSTDHPTEAETESVEPMPAAWRYVREIRPVTTTM